MKRRLLIPGACVLALLPVAGWSAPIEQVSLSLGTPHSTIQSAIDAVDDGGTVEIIESGEYVGPVRIPGGKTFTVRATAPDVVSTNAGESWIVPGPTSAGYVPGVVDVTLTGFIIRRTAGSGAALEVEVRGDPESVRIGANFMTVEHTAIHNGGEAVLVIDRANLSQDGGIGFSPSWGVEFRTAQASGTPKSAFRVHSDGVSTVSSFGGFFHGNTLTNSADAPALSIQTSDDLSLFLSHSQIDGPGTGVEVGGEGTNATLLLHGLDIASGRRCLSADLLTSWTQIVGCSFDNSASTTGEPPVVIETLVNYSPIPFTSFFVVVSPVFLQGCRIVSGDVAAGLPSIVISPHGASLNHNTFIAADAGTYPALVLQAPVQAPSVSSNLFLNFNSPDFLSADSGWRNNVVVGPVDDPTRGTNSAYLFAAPGLANAIAAAAVDPANHMPLAGSIALGAGYPSALGGGGQPLGTNPDVGWFENATLPLPQGDVNNDGILDLTDVTELGNYIAGHVAMPAGDLDVDNNGVVNQLDIDYLADFFVGNGPNPQP